MDEEGIFYHIVLTKRGSIEVFNGVLSHRVNVPKDVLTIEYSGQRNEGLTTVVSRRFSEYYDINVGRDSGTWWPKGTDEPLGTTLTVNG